MSGAENTLSQNEYAYLDLLEKKLDRKQKAVCCREGNTIVAAGAGSGKTQVLATRFAWLVMSMGIRAPQILTLTSAFTKPFYFLRRIRKLLLLKKNARRPPLMNFQTLTFKLWIPTVILL